MSRHVLGERFEDALVYATHLHREQLRKGTSIPYVAHLLAVASLVLEHGGGEDEAIAALLHDAVEDAGGASVLEEIRSRYGEAVADIVDGCTDAYGKPKPPWLTRKKSYIAKLSGASQAVRLVSCADKLHNALSTMRDYRTHGEVLWNRFNATRNDLLWYYRALADEFLENGPTLLARELDRVVRELESAVPP